MSDSQITSAIIAKHGGDVAMLESLSSQGIKVEVFETVQQVLERVSSANADETPFMIVRVGDVAANLAAAEARIRVITDALPLAAVVAASSKPPAPLVIAALRGGACDFVDLGAWTPKDPAPLIKRVNQVYAARLAQPNNAGGGNAGSGALREMCDAFLRDLIKTERRCIDLEHRLAQRERSGPAMGPSAMDANREPCVFLIDDDRAVIDRLTAELEDAGIITFSFLSGEDALLEAERMLSVGQAIDLALVDVRLPGLDGLETIRRLRELKSDLDAFLVTGYADPNIASLAAELKVVGYVVKPFDDVRQMVGRIRDLTRDAMQKSRDQHYLSRIKERHDQVLTQYSQLKAQLDTPT